jgi:transcriptional regulator of acetoin/glycerol metabolism
MPGAAQYPEHRVKTATVLIQELAATSGHDNQDHAVQELDKCSLSSGAVHCKNNHGTNAQGTALADQNESCACLMNTRIMQPAVM